MWIPRTLASSLLSISNTFPVLVLTGPRQVGKTSLLERTFPGYRYVSLDASQNAEAATTRPDEFLKRYPPPVILDEVQYAPGILRTVKGCVDERRGENGLFLITGSQSFPLMESVTESLAGRAAVIDFLGLSFAEWHAAFGDLRTPDRDGFLLRGGFPALWADPDAMPDRSRWYQGYVATYLERDVRNLLDIGNLRDFERFLRVCASRTARTLNMSDMGRDVGVSPTTARQWLNVLAASGQILLLEPYYRSLGKRLAKSPKLYFTDTGLASYLMGIENAGAMESSTMAGSLWENHVVCQWHRWRQWEEPGASLWYWRDQAQNEVDLVVEANGRLWPIECKRKERPDLNDCRGILKMRDMYGREEVGASYIACLTDVPFDVDTGITAVPGWSPWGLRFSSGSTVSS